MLRFEVVVVCLLVVLAVAPASVQGRKPEADAIVQDNKNAIRLDRIHIGRQEKEEKKEDNKWLELNKKKTAHDQDLAERQLKMEERKDLLEERQKREVLEKKKKEAEEAQKKLTSELQKADKETDRKLKKVEKENEEERERRSNELELKQKARLRAIEKREEQNKKKLEEDKSSFNKKSEAQVKAYKAKREAHGRENQAKRAALDKSHKGAEAKHKQEERSKTTGHKNAEAAHKKKVKEERAKAVKRQEQAKKAALAKEKRAKHTAEQKRKGHEKNFKRLRERKAKARRNQAAHYCNCHTRRAYFQGHNRWINCPNGYLVTGIWRHYWHHLNSIYYYRCCRPCRNKQPLAVTGCRTANWGSSFDRKGWSWCPSNHYVQGFYKSSCNWIYCLEHARCCRINGSRGAKSCNSKRSWWGSFDRSGWSMLSSHYFMRGLYRNGGGHHLYRIEMPHQCQVYAY